MGDVRDVFERAVLAHADAAYTLARHLVGAEADARDVLQESLLKAWKSFGTFRGIEARDGLPWLLQIVRNTAYTLLGRRRPMQTLDEEGLEEEADPARELLAGADAAQVRAAVAALPEIYREAIVLRELEGLSYKEIATVTGASLGTVMSRLSRARGQLHSLLSRQMEKGAK